MPEDILAVDQPLPPTLELDSPSESEGSPPPDQLADYIDSEVDTHDKRAQARENRLPFLISGRDDFRPGRMMHRRDNSGTSTYHTASSVTSAADIIPEGEEWSVEDKKRQGKTYDLQTSFAGCRTCAWDGCLNDSRDNEPMSDQKTGKALANGMLHLTELRKVEDSEQETVHILSFCPSHGMEVIKKLDGLAQIPGEKGLDANKIVPEFTLQNLREAGEPVLTVGELMASEKYSQDPLNRCRGTTRPQCGALLAPGTTLCSYDYTFYESIRKRAKRPLCNFKDKECDSSSQADGCWTATNGTLPYDIGVAFKPAEVTRMADNVHTGLSYGCESYLISNNCCLSCRKPSQTPTKLTNFDCQSCYQKSKSSIGDCDAWLETVNTDPNVDISKAPWFPYAKPASHREMLYRIERSFDRIQEIVNPLTARPSRRRTRSKQSGAAQSDEE